MFYRKHGSSRPWPSELPQSWSSLQHQILGKKDSRPLTLHYWCQAANSQPLSLMHPCTQELSCGNKTSLTFTILLLSMYGESPFVVTLKATQTNVWFKILSLHQSHLLLCLWANISKQSRDLPPWNNRFKASQKHYSPLTWPLSLVYIGTKLIYFLKSTMWNV